MLASKLSFSIPCPSYIQPTSNSRLLVNQHVEHDSGPEDELRNLVIRTPGAKHAPDHLHLKPFSDYFGIGEGSNLVVRLNS